ncbi:MAG: glycosyltransferase, partial [Terracidiphilus sp.]
MKNFVCAVVVTYHPKPEDIENLAKVRPQVEDLVVVDNGSSAETLKLLRAASAAGTYTLIENGENLGIAAALNMGVQYSIDRGFVWTILFDQDSSVTPDYISAMLKAIESTKESFLNVGIFCPRYVDRNTGIERPLFNVDEYGEPLSNMTSGSMIPNELFK